MAERGTILVIEDDEGIRESIKLTLEYAGYHVLTAENGKEAIDLLTSGVAPCLILLDLMMPVMDGWTFASEIKKDGLLAKIPIVVVSAFADKAQSLDVVRIIKKPVDIDTLLNLADQYCA